MVELKPDGEDEDEDELDKCFAIVKELPVGGFIVEIDSEGAVLTGCFSGLGHVSSPCRQWWMRMRHGERNALKDCADWERIRALPRNSVECELLKPNAGTGASAVLSPQLKDESMGALLIVCYEPTKKHADIGEDGDQLHAKAILDGSYTGQMTTSHQLPLHQLVVSQLPLLLDLTSLAYAVTGGVGWGVRFFSRARRDWADGPGRSK